MTIPAPSVLHCRGGRKGISTSVYPDLDAFFADLGQAYKDVVKAFYDAGCRYLQFDDTVWAYLCSQKELELARQRGDDRRKKWCSLERSTGTAPVRVEVGFFSAVGE